MSTQRTQIGIIKKDCPKCGYKESKQMIMGEYMEYGECVKCGTSTYCKIFKNPLDSYTTKCPYCHSTNVKKISKTSKVAYGATFGIFAASKLVHQWHCNNCKSDF